jgi:hypothetical protein
MTKGEIIQVAREAYPGAFPANREHALEHEIGDTLGDFIFLELDECLTDEDDETNLGEAIRLMEVARSDVQAVLNALVEG